jgi:nucleoside-diphosphate-sugar epimerase
MTQITMTGCAGLVGQNLSVYLSKTSDQITGVDRNEVNIAIWRSLHPSRIAHHLDLSESCSPSLFHGADVAVVLHAQITGKTREPFDRNNIAASENVFAAIKAAGVPFTVHVSSSVVKSIANDDYTQTKKIQEQMFRDSGLVGCVVRPTLMYGWFDPKHFGWLARLMERVPAFPIPGDGRFMRQPLYVRDFCRVIEWCIKNRPVGAAYDIVGNERVDYIDIIRAIKRVKGLQTPIVKIPYGLFDLGLKAAALVTDKPPFTSSQLKALTAGDDFVGVDIEATFGFKPTSLEDGLRETFCHPVYSKYQVERTD